MNAQMVDIISIECANEIRACGGRVDRAILLSHMFRIADASKLHIAELEQENQKMREANERWESAIRRVCGTPEPDVRLPNPLT